MYSPEVSARQFELRLLTLKADTVTKLARLMPKLTTLEISIKSVAQEAEDTLVNVAILLVELAPTICVLKLYLLLDDDSFPYSPFHALLSTLNSKLTALEHLTLYSRNWIFAGLNFQIAQPLGGGGRELPGKDSFITKQSLDWFVHQLTINCSHTQLIMFYLRN